MAPQFLHPLAIIWNNPLFAGPDLAEPAAFAIAALKQHGLDYGRVQAVRDSLAEFFADQTAIAAHDGAEARSHTDLFIAFYSAHDQELIEMTEALSLLIILPVLLLQDAVDRHTSGALRAYALLVGSRNYRACKYTGEITFTAHSSSRRLKKIADEPDDDILHALEQVTIDNIVFVMEDQLIMENLLCARVSTTAVMPAAHTIPAMDE